jgi:hypothetical protein
MAPHQTYLESVSEFTDIANAVGNVITTFSEIKKAIESLKQNADKIDVEKAKTEVGQVEELFKSDVDFQAKPQSGRFVKNKEILMTSIKNIKTFLGSVEQLPNTIKDKLLDGVDKAISNVSKALIQFNNDVKILSNALGKE